MIYGCLMEDLRVISILWQNNGISFSPSASDLACAQLTYWLPDIWWLSHMLHIPTKLGDFFRANVGIHIPAPWIIWVLWLIDAYFFTYFFGCEIPMSNSKCSGPWGWMMNVGGWRKSLRHGPEWFTIILVTFFFQQSIFSWVAIIIIINAVSGKWPMTHVDFKFQWPKPWPV